MELFFVLISGDAPTLSTPFVARATPAAVGLTRKPTEASCDDRWGGRVGGGTWAAFIGEMFVEIVVDSCNRCANALASDIYRNAHSYCLTPTQPEYSRTHPECFRPSDAPMSPLFYGVDPLPLLP